MSEHPETTEICPMCDAVIQAGLARCPRCRADIGPLVWTGPSPTPARLGAIVDGSIAQAAPPDTDAAGPGAKQGSVLVAVLVVLAVGAVVLGFVAPGFSAITQTAIFALAAVIAILARLAQASHQHSEVMRELRRR